MSRAPKTRQSLLLELSKRSDDAWSEFLEVYESAIHGFCRAMGLQEADARDATQEVLTAVHERIPTWDPDAAAGSFRSWLFRVARNVSADLFAERRRGLVAEGGPEVDRELAQIPDSHDPDRTAFDEEVRRSLFEWAASRVKGEVRDVTWRSFELTAIEGWKAERAAEELGVSVGSVYTAKCRVVARIRERITHWSGEFPARPESS